jgi:hypothetical protein
MVPFEDVRPYTYQNHIPQLKKLMPQNGGRPGVTYLQCCIHNLRKAQDMTEKEGGPWGFISGGSKVYTIVGPRGAADMQLMCKGEPIPGGDPKSGVCECFVDGDVEELTGLRVNRLEEPEPKPRAYEDAETIKGLGTFAAMPEGEPVSENSTEKSEGDTEK